MMVGQWNENTESRWAANVYHPKSMFHDVRVLEIGRWNRRNI